ncbi:DUF222 domain-containing protein [Conyzicola sp.]|uniref:HNH endonuclease signature motif containing protein n=1 Tax=Conyzicola sp. TaxID=1969404 RepID=UPI00398929DB
MNEAENDPAADAYSASADGGGGLCDPPPDVIPPAPGLDPHPSLDLDPGLDPDPGLADYRAALDDVEAAERAIATAHAARAAAIDRLRVRSEQMSFAASESPGDHGWSERVCAEKIVVMELVGVLRVSDNTARNLVWESKFLMNQLPETLTALREGSISYPHARVMIDQGSSVPDESVEEFEQTLLPTAKEVTVPKLKKAAIRLREKLQPSSSVERHIEAVEKRTVWFEPGDDGMAVIGATLSAEVVQAIRDRLATIASAPTIAGDERTMAQKRADAFTDLLLTGDTCEATTEGTGGPRPNVGHGIRPKVLVTVPVMTLLGRSDEPGDLEGYGPIDPETARQIAATAPSFTRLLVHPVSSAILDFDRTTYAVPADLKNVVRVRDGVCRAIGCEQPATHAELDHTRAWAGGGTTKLGNLACLCADHHRVKTHTRVKMRNLPNGDIEWELPSGRTYLTHPATHLPEAA